MPHMSQHEPAGIGASGATVAGDGSEHDHEGQSIQAWTACGGVIAASLVAGAAVILESVGLGVVSVLVALVCLSVAGLIGRSRQR